MNKTWLLVVVLAIGTALFLSYIYVSPIKEWVNNTGVASTVDGYRTQITDAINNNPMSLLGISGGIVGTMAAYIRNARSRIQTGQINLKDTIVQAQQEKGSLMAGFNDVKDTLTGAKDKLQSEFDTLKVESETQITDLKDLVDTKDNKIIDVQDELTKAQQQLIAQGRELKEAVTQRDEYRIALKIKEVPTLN